MNNKTPGTLLLLLLFCTSFIACTDDDTKVNVSDFTLKLIVPNDLNDARLSDINVTFNNINTGKSTTNTFTSTENTISLAEGLYTISAESNISYILDEETAEGQVKGYKESVNISGETSTGTLELFRYNVKPDFVIEEIYFAGSTTPEGKAYKGDQYIRIRNNSENVLYADGVTILESTFTSSLRFDYTPDIMSKAMAVQIVYSIPGNGTEYPVQPGQSILICDKAIDHRTANSNSFDLRGADFEWYNEHALDIDNPEVPNLKNIYGYTKTVWNLHDQGLKTYAIARLQADPATFIKEYLYEYEYINSNITLKRETYKIPNEWIIDAVNLSNKGQHIWNPVDASLDMGYTYCGEINGDKTRYDKSARRKTISLPPDGRKALKDTNNSSEDFEARATPSLKE